MKENIKSKATADIHIGLNTHIHEIDIRLNSFKTAKISVSVEMKPIPPEATFLFFIKRSL